MSATMKAMRLRIEFDRETDGRWIAEIPSLRGVHGYGATRDEAIARVKAAALFALSEAASDGQPIEDAILFDAA